MATINLQVAKTEYSRGEPRKWEREIVLDTPGESEWIIIPEQVDIISITVSFTGGATGKIQTTTERVYIVKTGSPLAEDWSYGVVSVSFTKTCKPCSAIRAVMIHSGTMKITIISQ